LFLPDVTVAVNIITPNGPDVMDFLRWGKISGGTGKEGSPRSYPCPEVMRVDGKDGLLLRASRLFDLPADAVAGVPRIEVLGDEELRMSPHRGILAYGPEEIHISGGNLVVRVRGTGLELRAMTPAELLITGRIQAVEFVR